MTVGLFGILAGVVVFATGGLLTIQLINLVRTPTSLDAMEQKRRDIVVPSVMMIGMAAATWVICFAVDVWWNLIRGSAF